MLLIHAFTFCQMLLSVRASSSRTFPSVRIISMPSATTSS